MSQMQRIVDEERGVETHQRRARTKLKLKRIDQNYPDPEQYAEMREAMGYNLPVNRLGDADPVEERYRNDNGDWQKYYDRQIALGRIPLPRKEFLAGAFNMDLAAEDESTEAGQEESADETESPLTEETPDETGPEQAPLNRHFTLRQFCGLVERECRKPEVVVMFHAQMTARKFFANTEEQYRQLWNTFLSQ